MKNKTGAIDLSMNTIVIVIFGIVVLGLGLALTQGLFGKATEKTFSVLDKADLKVQPSQDQPFIVSPSRFEITRGKSVAIQVGVFDTDTPSATAQILIGGDCTGTKGISTNLPASNGRPIKLGETVGWEFSVRAANSIQSGDYLCTIQLDGLGQTRFQDINIVVR